MTDETVVWLNRAAQEDAAAQTLGNGPGRPWLPAVQCLEVMAERARANGAVGVLVVLAYPGGGTQSAMAERDMNASNALVAGLVTAQAESAGRILAESDVYGIEHPPPDDVH